MTIRVVAAIIRKEGELLITRRARNVHLGGLWEFPGGKVESGETLEAALVREIREELAAEITVCDELLSVTHAYPERTVELHFFNCRIIAGEPQPLAADELRWIESARLTDFDFPAADKELIELLQRN